MRRLCWMVVGKQRNAWDHTAALLALHVNINRGKNDKPVSPVELNPYREGEAARMTRDATDITHTFRRLAFLPVEERKRILAKMEEEKQHGTSD